MMLGLITASVVVQIFYWIVLGSGFDRALWSDLDAASGDENPLMGNEPLPVADETRMIGDEPPPIADEPPPMSVVVAARNEESNLPVLLDALSRQTHPHHEIIIVNDGSEDSTQSVLDAWQDRLPHLVAIRTDGTGKKEALRKGIEAAAFNLLALTDADCEPPPNWLQTLASSHAACSEECVLVGYSPFRGSETWAQRSARYETFVTGFLTAAAAGLGRPYMAVGRNLSYHRTVFEGVGGFDPIMHSLSGDDDLFVQEVVRRKAAPVKALLSPESFVPTAAPRLWREWLRQKLRHASGGRFYDRGMQAHLAAFHGSNLLLWLAPFVIGWAGALALGVKLTIQFIVLRGAARALRETALMPLFPVLEAMYLLYNVVVAPMGIVWAPKRW